MFPGRFEDFDSAVDVVVVDLLRLFDTLLDGSLCGLVVDNVGIGDEIVDGIFLGNRGLDEFVAPAARVGRLPTGTVWSLIPRS